jgi:hypothetical protein
MKILVFCPTYARPDGALAVYPDTQASLDALEFGDHEVTVLVRPSPSADRENNIFHQYQFAEHETLSGGYDAVLFVEHDMIVPPDALLKLAEAPADVAYGVYLFRHGKPMLSAFRATSGAGIDQSLQNFPDELRRAAHAGTWPVSGLGFGCTLIHARVFERVHMRQPENGHYPDGPFAADAKRQGFKQVARFDVICGHIRPDGYVLWPRFDGRDLALNMVRVKILRSFTASLGGQSVPFAAGQDAKMPLDDAVEYQRAGYVSISDATPQVKIVNKPERKLKVAVK